MANVTDHYENLLADHYSWIHGELEPKVEENKQFFTAYSLLPRSSKICIDLGAGPGFQALALAQLGYSVTAVDTSQKLLGELTANAANLAITTKLQDMSDFVADNATPAELYICMGDTLTHLPSFAQVKKLIKDVYTSLEKGGTFVLTFRDLVSELAELDRFIPVRSDHSSIFTCFLEYEPETVKVHDLIYIKTEDGWDLKKSFYRKLRISHQWVTDMLLQAGFILDISTVYKGLVTIIASK
ncbi:MAG: class I SAM-dependent methyltransferase [Chloroflexota bacterium]